MRAQQGLSGTQQGLAVPDDCRPPEPKTPGIHQLTVSPAVAPLTGDVLEQLGLCLLWRRPSIMRSSAIAQTPRWVPRVRLPPCCVCLIAGSQRVLRSRAPHCQSRWSARSRIPCAPSITSAFPIFPWGSESPSFSGHACELAQLLDESGEKYASTIVEAISATVRRLRERQRQVPARRPL